MNRGKITGVRWHDETHHRLPKRRNFLPELSAQKDSRLEIGHVFIGRERILMEDKRSSRRGDEEDRDRDKPDYQARLQE